MRLREPYWSLLEVNIWFPWGVSAMRRVVAPAATRITSWEWLSVCRRIGVVAAPGAAGFQALKQPYVHIHRPYIGRFIQIRNFLFRRSAKLASVTKPWNLKVIVTITELWPCELASDACHAQTTYPVDYYDIDLGLWSARDSLSSQTLSLM